MKVIFSNQPQLDKPCESIFLAGPTPRDCCTHSWRPEAVSILEKFNYHGTVLVPEYGDWRTLPSYEHQIEWEYSCLNYCYNVVFWIPRDLEKLPGFTTNVEFGYCLAKDSSKVFYGRPKDSPKNKYLDWMYNKHSTYKIYESLEDLLLFVVFKSLVKEWKQQKIILSNMTVIEQLKPYQDIIALGELVVPLIIEELKENPDWYFSALSTITRENPVLDKDRGFLNKMAQSWISYYEP